MGDTFSRFLSFFLPLSSLHSYNFLIVNIQHLFSLLRTKTDDRMIIGDHGEQLYVIQW